MELVGKKLINTTGLNQLIKLTSDPIFNYNNLRSILINSLLTITIETIYDDMYGEPRSVNSNDVKTVLEDVLPGIGGKLILGDADINAMLIILNRIKEDVTLPVVIECLSPNTVIYVSLVNKATIALNIYNINPNRSLNGS